MPGITDSDLLRLWERGVGCRTPERALEMLGAAEPETTWEERAALPLAIRDRRLLDVRRELFGDVVQARHACPDCNSTVELSTTVSALQSATPEWTSADFQFSVDGHVARVRAPNSFDIMAALQHERSGDSSTALLERCVTLSPNSQSDAALPRESIALSDASRATLFDAIERASGVAALQLSLTCPECSARSFVDFDIVAFLWQEIAAEARRLTRDVAALARAFAWSEESILSLSATRRKLYLELAQS